MLLTVCAVHEKVHLWRKLCYRAVPWFSDNILWKSPIHIKKKNLPTHSDVVFKWQTNGLFAENA